MIGVRCKNGESETSLVQWTDFTELEKKTYVPTMGSKFWVDFTGRFSGQVLRERERTRELRGPSEDEGRD